MYWSSLLPWSIEGATIMLSSCAAFHDIFQKGALSLALPACEMSSFWALQVSHGTNFKKWHYTQISTEQHGVAVPPSDLFGVFQCQANTQVLYKHKQIVHVDLFI